MKISAQNLRIGDLVIVNAQVSWRVDAIEPITGKMIYYRATYQQCDFVPGHVGTHLSYRHRLDTTLTVVRDEESAEPSEAEIMAAIETLSKTMRYSVKGNELGDWIA